MDQLSAIGHAIDAILVLTVIEGIALTILYRRTGRGVAPAGLWSNLASGGCLLLAFRAAVAGAGLGVIALPMLAALVAHVADLRLRWRG